MVELPQRVPIVPAVVPDETVEADSMFLIEIGIERADHFEALRLVHALERIVEVVAVDVEIIPRVVMPILAIRMGALALEVVGEGAAELTFGSDADRGGKRPGDARSEGEIPWQGCGDIARCQCAIVSGTRVVFRHRVFEAEKPIAIADGRSIGVTDRFGSR